VPSILLDVVTRSFEPRQALVLLRRTAAESEPGRHERLVVAAVAGDDSPWTPGLEIQLGEGELGLVAEAQRAMSRHDLDQHPVAPEAGGLAAFKPELAAPMVFDGSTVGLIGLAGIRRAPADSKAALHLLAQLGAVAIHNLAAFSRVQQSAHLDGLTQVFNKKHTTQLLSELLYECQKKPAPLSIFLFDIDHFKAYNDTNGHVAGDQLLRLVARLVRDNVRAGDVFGRFGGEEFLLVLPGTDLGPARRVAEKVRRAIADHPFPSAERQPLGCVSVSGGIAVCPTHALDSRGLLLAADQALYAAKHGGRNQVAVAESKYLSSDDEQFAGAAADSVQR
jgi:diguanylate cyclase (GGDEF)-like protein